MCSSAGRSARRVDHLGRNLRHLVTRLEELQSLGVAFVSLAEGIDATTPAGKLQMQIWWQLPSLNGRGSLSGSRRGWRGPRRGVNGWVVPFSDVPVERLQSVYGLSLADGARKLRVSVSTLKRWRRAAQEPFRNPSASCLTFAPKQA